MRHYHAHTGTWFFQVACRMTHDRTAGAYGSIRAKTRRENTRRKRGTSEVADLTILQFSRAFAALCPADSPRRTAWPLPSHRLLQTEWPHTERSYRGFYTNPHFNCGLVLGTQPSPAARPWSVKRVIRFRTDVPSRLQSLRQPRNDRWNEERRATSGHGKDNGFIIFSLISHIE